MNHWHRLQLFFEMTNNSAISSLNDFLLYYIISYINPIDCIRLSETNFLFNLICNNDIIWKSYCQLLWYNKIHKPHIMLSKNYKSLYYRSILLSKYSIISYSDLNKYIFSFRFKEDAGEHWISHCPWHNNKEATIVKFQSSKTVIRYINKDDIDGINLTNQYSSDSDTRLFKTQLNTLDSSSLIDYNHQHDFNDKEYVIDPYYHFSIRWEIQWINKQKVRYGLRKYQNKLINLLYVNKRFYNHVNILECNDLLPFEKHCLLGNQINENNPNELIVINNITNKLNLNNQFNQSIDYILQSGLYGNGVCVYAQNIAVPIYHIFRSPLNNWGYMLESCWAFYTSWRMPLLGECAELEDENLNISAQQQHHEINAYNNTLWENA